MLVEALAECSALVGVFNRLLVADTGEADTLDDDTDALQAGLVDSHIKNEV